MPSRRHVLIGLAGAVPALSFLDVRAAKSGLCEPCAGDGNCTTKNCTRKNRCGFGADGNPCAGRKLRTLFGCYGKVPKCCERYRYNCVAISNT